MAKSSGPARQIHERTYGEERDRMVDATKAEIIKKFGDGSIMRYGDGGPSSSRGHSDRSSTPRFPASAAFRARHIIEIYGPESSVNDFFP